jgi:hypothetical protein
MKNLYFTFAFILGFGLANAQSSKDYQPSLPDYNNQKSISPIPMAPPPPPNPIPVDGGVGFLVVAGIGYGLKKYKDAK